MKVLWLCNIVLPEVSEEFGFKKKNIGGWLSGMWNRLKVVSDIQLGVCVPIIKPENMHDGVTKEGHAYYSFALTSGTENIALLVARFSEIIEAFHPDVVHIWGTEYPHTAAMVEACRQKNLIDRVLINIQGLLFKYTEAYRFGLPEAYVDKEYLSMRERTPYELQALKNARHVCGRTAWDKASVLEVNDAVNYHYCGEILRDYFYKKDDTWDCKKCRRHSIFISQAGYPIKGLHTVIGNLAKLKICYPDLLIRIAGTDLRQQDSPYAAMILEALKTNDLSENVEFLGMLTAEQMYDEFLHAHVFLSLSLIENSSNSICEALRVGVPVVASDTGGTASIITHGLNGFLYDLKDTSKMTSYVSRIFDEDDLAEQISEKEQERSEEYNNPKKCLNELLVVYAQLAKV
jgi:L-malate glycosyltransferase